MQTNPIRINTILIALLVAGIFTVPFLNTSVSADDRIPDQNPRKPGSGVVGLAELQSSQSTCLNTQPSSSTKGGIDIDFIVPSTITNVKNSGNPSNAVNFHVAFVGSDSKYYEVGMYYGSWTVGQGVSGYDPNNFQFAYGKGGQISGVSTVPVVAGHEVELSLMYSSSAGEWQAWINDKTASQLQILHIGSSTVNIASDIWNWVEANAFNGNSNSQTLGLITVNSLLKGTRVTGDGVNWQNWSHGYLTKACQASQNNGYGITYLNSPGKYKIGYGGATTANAQFW